MGGASASNLVVEDHRDLMRLDEIGDGEEITVCDAGTTMEDDERHPGARLDVSEDLVPSLAGIFNARDLEFDFPFHGER